MRSAHPYATLASAQLFVRPQCALRRRVSPSLFVFFLLSVFRLPYVDDRYQWHICNRTKYSSNDWWSWKRLAIRQSQTPIRIHMTTDLCIYRRGRVPTSLIAGKIPLRPIYVPRSWIIYMEREIEQKLSPPLRMISLPTRVALPSTFHVLMEPFNVVRFSYILLMSLFHCGLFVMNLLVSTLLVGLIALVRSIRIEKNKTKKKQNTLSQKLTSDCDKTHQPGGENS